MLRRYILYLIRWQLSTPILAPMVAMFKHSESIFGTAADWTASAVANLVGGLIFFWVDRFIFTSKALDMPVWTVKEQITCVDCGREGRGYRLVKSGEYDRTQDAEPEFRCEDCSARKAERLQEQGVVLE